MIAGQIVIVYREDAEWEYGVIRNVFDQEIHIETETKEYLYNPSDKEIEVQVITQRGEIVKARKNIFGKYKFEPKFYGKYISHIDKEIQHHLEKFLKRAREVLKEEDEEWNSSM